MTQPRAFDASGVQFAWDSTSIKLAESCLRKYYYKMIEGWAPERLSVHLRFGQHYASALEHFYKRLALGEDREDALVAIVHETLLATWDHETCSHCKGEGMVEEPSGLGPSNLIFCDECYNGKIGGTAWESEHPTKTRENLIRTIIWYLDQFADDRAETYMLANGQPAVEYSYTLPVDDGIVLAGHLDRVVTWQDKPYITDQKTTGSTLTSRYFRDYDLDTQMSGYTFAGKAIFGLPIAGVIIDAAQIAVGFSRFERGFTFRSEDQLNEWYDHTMHFIGAARQATRENYFPMNLSACRMFGGCEFAEVCSRSPHVREQFLRAKFVKGKRWDPMEKR